MAAILGYSDPYSMGALLGARATRTPVLTQSDSNWDFESRRPAAVRALKTFALKTLFSSRRTLVSSISDDNARYWKKHGFRSLIRIPFESPIPEPERDITPPELPQLYVLFVGRLIAIKRPEDAIAAVSLARDALPLLELVIVGAGDELTGTQPPWVHRAGPVERDKLSWYYKHASALIVPSSFEPYGLVVREALQFGTPVVGSSEVAAIPALCPRGFNVVPVGDTHGLSRALLTAINQGRWKPLPPIDTTHQYLNALHSLISDARSGRGMDAPKAHRVVE